MYFTKFDSEIRKVTDFERDFAIIARSRVCVLEYSYGPSA